MKREESHKRELTSQCNEDHKERDGKGGPLKRGGDP